MRRDTERNWVNLGQSSGRCCSRGRAPYLVFINDALQPAYITYAQMHNVPARGHVGMSLYPTQQRVLSLDCYDKWLELVRMLTGDFSVHSLATSKPFVWPRREYPCSRWKRPKFSAYWCESYRVTKDGQMSMVIEGCWCSNWEAWWIRLMIPKPTF